MGTSYNVARARRACGMSQKQLADALGITQQSVYYYESGDRDIKASVLVRMAEVMDCTVSFLLGITGDPEERVGDVPVQEADEMAELTHAYQQLPDDGRRALMAALAGIAAEYGSR